MMIDSVLNQFKKNELWKYTSLKTLAETTWLAPASVGLSHDQLSQLSKLLLKDATNYVFVDGQLDKTLSDDTQPLIKVQPQSAINFLGSDTVLSQILGSTPACKINLTIAAKNFVEKPVHILFVSSAGQQHVVNYELDVNLEAQSQLYLVTQSISLNQSSSNLNLTNVNLQLRAASKCEWLNIQDLNQQSSHLVQNSVLLERDSYFDFADLTLGALLSRSNTETFFKSENAQAGLFSCMALNQDQHGDLYSSINHLKGHNQSNQLAKSILNGNSSSVFRGRVYIAQNAQKANSEQLNNNLLLSRTAKANSVPQLEIYADDVKAGHGSTMGQMNQDEIFYFLSRGISETAAVKMIAEGFAKEIVFKLKDERLQKVALAKLQNKLDRMI